MHMKRILFSLFALCALTLSLSAKPARRGAMTLTQPDGTTITAYLHGDAFYHYYTTADGKMLQRDGNGFYQPAPMLPETDLKERFEQAPRRVVRLKKAGSELNLAPRGLIILVNFTDLELKTEKAEMDSMLNGLNYSRRYQGYTTAGKKTVIISQGSARQYFHDTSFGQYNPVFDVVGPVTVSKSHDYYGENNRQGDDKHVEDMIKEACELVEDEVDFTLYDNNNDGKVDFVYVIYAGYGEADGAGDDYIWPHNYHLSYTGTNCVVDGKKVDNYACSNELDYYSKEHDGIGTFCHEFSHVLGLPDLYVTNNGTHKTMGAWDILDYGPYNNDGNTPPHYSAYERFFMGWLKPTILNRPCDAVLSQLGTTNTAAILTATGEHNLIGNDPMARTFYMLENRQKEGWDQFLPGHGMLITKINYSQSKWAGNTVNNTSSSMGVDIIEADGKTPSFSQTNSNNGYAGKIGDAYPAGSDSFTKLPEYQVTAIDEIDGKITFKVNGGGDMIKVAVEDVFQPATSTAKKIIRNGQILIERNGVYYDLMGNRQ